MRLIFEGESNDYKSRGHLKAHIYSSFSSSQLFNFLWKNKTHYIKKSVNMNTTENGGLDFLDFTTLNYTFKINWIK